MIFYYFLSSFFLASKCPEVIYFQCERRVLGGEGVEES